MWLLYLIDFDIQKFRFWKKKLKKPYYYLIFLTILRQYPDFISLSASSKTLVKCDRLMGSVSNKVSFCSDPFFVCRFIKILGTTWWRSDLLASWKICQQEIKNTFYMCMHIIWIHTCYHTSNDLSYSNLYISKYLHTPENKTNKNILQKETKQEHSLITENKY